VYKRQGLSLLIGSLIFLFCLEESYTAVTNSRDFLASDKVTSSLGDPSSLFAISSNIPAYHDFGSFTYKADIYDEDEGTDAGSSPASDHLFTIVNELQSTGTNPNVNGTLAHYLSEKIDQYPKGYLFITRYSEKGEDHIPGIMTQMLATSPKSNSVVTNWFDPIAR
jgi:hypothetical protein